MRIIVRHWWSFVFWIGVALLVGASGGFYGRVALLEATPVPYTFDLDEAQTGYREDGYHLTGIVHKMECERLPVPAGFSVEVSAVGNSDPYRAEWLSVQGRDVDESRPEGSAPLHILIDLPSSFSVARVWTAHACPAVDAENVIMVRTLLHEIPGNVIEQRVLSPSEVTK